MNRAVETHPDEVLRPRPNVYIIAGPRTRMSHSDDERVEQLEARLDAVEETLERYRTQHALLLAAVDVNALDDPDCPACGDATLTKESGLSWAKAVCRGCGAEWPIKG